MKTAGNQHGEVQARFKRFYDARRRRMKDDVLSGVLISVKATLADHKHKIATAPTGSFPIVAVNTHTVPIQRPANSVENVSRNDNAKK